MARTRAAMRRIIFVRHGQSEMNLKQAGIVGGRSNASPLTPLGERQVRRRPAFA